MQMAPHQDCSFLQIGLIRSTSLSVRAVGEEMENTKKHLKHSQLSTWLLYQFNFLGTFPAFLPQLFAIAKKNVEIQDFFFWPRHLNSSSAWLQNYINKDEILAHANHGKTPTDLNEARLSPPPSTMYKPRFKIHFKNSALKLFFPELDRRGNIKGCSLAVFIKLSPSLANYDETTTVVIPHSHWDRYQN